MWQGFWNADDSGCLKRILFVCVTQSCFFLNVRFQKISILTPRMVIGNSEGEGGLDSPNF